MVNSIHYIRLQYKYGGTCSMETPRNDMETKVTILAHSQTIFAHLKEEEAHLKEEEEHLKEHRIWKKYSGPVLGISDLYTKTAIMTFKINIKSDLGVFMYMF